MSIKRTIITTILALAVVAVVAPGAAQALTTNDLLIQIQQLQAQLLQLQGQEQTGNTTGVLPANCVGITFSRNLSRTTPYMSGSDVRCLQTLLNQLNVNVADAGAGSPGKETIYFGGATRAAVIRFQEMFKAEILTPQGLTVGTGLVGPATRAKLNALLGNWTVVTPVTTLPAGCTSTAGFSPTTGASCATGVVINQTGTISATLSSDQPSASTISGGAIVSNQAQADLLHINFTGTGTVTSVTLQRSGISDQSTLTSVYLFDGATRITSGNTFNTNGALTFNGLSIAVNGLKEISVKADVVAGATLAPYNASTIAVALTGYIANGVSSSANLQGNTMTIVAGNLATANLTTGSGVVDPAVTTINAGSMNQTVWSRTVSIGTRTVELRGLTVKMIGSAPSNTLANVGLYVDGILAKTATINSNSQFVFDANSAPVTLSTGSHLLEVRADIIGGSYRNFYMSLEQGSDIAIRDPQLGVYLTTTAAGVTAYNINGGTVNISSGSLTISQDSSFNNVTTIVGGASNVKMASFKFTAYGEDMKVMSLILTPTITGGPAGSNTLANVGLYVNGGQVGSNQTATTAAPMSFPNLGSNLIVPVGTSVTVAIYGDAITSLGANYVTGTETFHLDSGTSQGVSSSQSYAVGAQGGQALAISSSNVSFAASTGFAVATAAPNSTSVKIGSFTLQTASSEGVTANSIAVTFVAGAGNTLIPANQLTNLKVMVGSTLIGTPIGNPVITTANNFSTNTPVPISSTTVFDVYADFGSSASGLTVTPSMAVTYRGATSNLSTTTSVVPGVQTTSGVASIVAGGVTFVPGSSLTAQYVTGNGSTTLPIATFNVVTANHVGGAVLQDVTFTVASTNTVNTITMNGKSGSVVGTTATIYNVGITVPSDNSGVNIPVTASLVNVGTGYSGVSSAPVSVEITTLTYNNGITIASISPTATSATLELAGTVPVITMTGSATTGLQIGNQQIGTFTVAAGGGGDLKLQAIPINTTIGGLTVTALNTITIRDSSGTQITGTNTIGAAGPGTFTFGTPRTISKNGSETYYVYGTTVGALGGAGTSNVTFALGDKGSFLWTDVSGGMAGLTGTNIYGYPTTSQTKSN